MKEKQTFIIAEIAQAHDGSLGILHSYIDALADAGVDAVKFQTHIAEAESSIHEPFRVNFSYEDKTRYDYWDRMGFNEVHWQGIKEHCDKAGVEFMSSPFSQAAVDLLERVGVKRYKIGSGEVTNFLMLEKICNTGKPIIISSGMSNYEELDNAVRFIEAKGNDLSILQCTTAYPTPYDRLGLNVITELKSRYPKHTIGLSEHTAEIYAGLAGVALGAEVLEFHAVWDKRMFGPDAKSSLTIDQIAKLVKGVRAIESSINNPIDKDDLFNYKSLKNIFEKTLAVNKDLKEGHILSFDDLEAKKPANHGIAASNFKEVIGRTLSRDVGQWEFLTDKDF